MDVERLRRTSRNFLSEENLLEIGWFLMTQKYSWKSKTPSTNVTKKEKSTETIVRKVEVM